ncbi:MAG TPA: potassium channel family protein [Propionicimonas sp.]|uniref:potassium channel family protein n=1 Tax=Propionicimonas sp. TaxID=1955623 RepID=UPI002F421068
MRRPWLNWLLLPVGILVAYFVVPVNADNAPVGVLLGVVLAVAGLSAVAWVVADEVQRAEKRLRLVHLLLALELVVVIFSLAYYWIAVHQPGEFNGMVTRLDALYFALTTVATVGYGDINAAGQLARLLVSIQLVFNVVFIAALVGLLQGRMREGRPGSRDGDDARE